MRQSVESKAQTRRRILHEAGRTLRMQGQERVVIADVMERAGRTYGTFYAHFRDKDDLIACTIGFMFDEQYEDYFRGLDQADPRSALATFVNDYLSMEHRGKPEAGCPLPTLSGEANRFCQDARDAFVAGADKVVDGVTLLLKRAGKHKPATLAEALIAEVSGLVTLSRVMHDDRRAEELLRSSKAAIKKRLGIDRLAA